MRKLSSKNKNLAPSGFTRNEYITCIKSFTKWAVEARRIPHDPLASLKRIERKTLRQTHPRRALTWSELGLLLDATVRRPLLELLTVRTGPNRGKPLAKVSEALKSKATRLGEERRLGYLLALWTGLRRNEIAQLAWGDIDLKCVPARIRLRAETTKSKRADSLIIHPQLADTLRAFCPGNPDPAMRVLRTVPSMRVLKGDLKLAGLEYGDQCTGYADLHASRVSLNTKMASEGINLRIRQAHMRHTDPRLTSITYTDESLLPIADELLRVPPIPGPEKAKSSTITYGT
jgi:integrase